MKFWKPSAERDAFSVPRSVQKSIPIKRVYKDGIFEVSGKFSKTWRFFDVNYKVASPEKQEDLFKAYCAFLNALPVNATAKITLFNRRLNQREFNANLFMPYKGDGLDQYRGEYNDLLADKAGDSNNLIQEKYITISTEARNYEEAKGFFNRVGTDLTTSLSRLDSTIREINLNERLRLFHDFFRPGEEQEFHFDLHETMKRGHDFKDAIAPGCLSFKKSYFEMDNCFGRTLFLRDYASFIKDSMITELMDYPRNMMLSIDIVPIGMDDAIKLVDKVIMSVDSDANRWQQRQNAHNNFTATLPYQLEQMRQVGKEYMDDLTERDQRMMHGVVTLTHLADSLEQLDQDTKSLQTRTGNCEFAVLNYQQEDALNTVLPYGLRRIDAVRTLTSESTAVLMPFKSQEIQDAGGIYYGVNPISHNLIICNRGSLMNGNGFIFGVSGSGKSMAAKQEITTLALATDHDIIIIDPEREYGPLVRALGGEIITISASSDTYINAMDISSEYGGGQNPLALKSDFIMSLCEQIMGAEQISARDKSIIDRCTANVYREYIKTYKGDPPTLKDLHDDLMRQKEPAAHDIALALELFTTGTLDVFAHQTNVNSRNRILCFDIQDLGENLKPIGLLVMLDAIMNRVIANRAEGKYTHVYIDEIYLFFAGSSKATDAQVKAAKSAIEAADRAYKALSDEQKGYITVGDSKNYNALVERLAKLTSTSASTIIGNQTAPGSSVIEPTTTVSGSIATATVTDKTVTSAIKAVKDSGETAITIVPTDIGNAKNVSVTLPKTAAQSIVDDTNVSLVIETNGGNVTIPNDALKSIAAQASGGSITITVEQKTAADVTDKSIDTTDAVVVAVTVTSGSTAVTEFGGKSLTISIPAGSKHVEGQNYKVIEISADGTQKVLTGKCVKVDGKLVIQVSTTGLSTFVATTQKTLSFTDVKESDYYYEPVKWAVEKGITNGTTATTFSPNAGCTRAQMVTFLWRAAGSPEPSGKTNPFSDVDENAYYFKALLWAVENGITNGTSATTFSPDAVCTRGQMAAFLYRNAKTPAVSGSTSFTDVTDGDYFSDAVVWAAQEGITVGTSDTTFSPAATCTRGQMVTFLYRYLAD